MFGVMVAAANGQWTMDSGQWTVDKGQWTVDNGQWTVDNGQLLFLAAYSGQLAGSYDHPWFVPPVVDYLDPDCYFQKEQAEIVHISRKMEELRESGQRKEWQMEVARLREEREMAVDEAKRIYKEGKRDSEEPSYIRLRQFQKANIQRAKQLHREEIAELEGRLASINTTLHDLFEERKRRSEALQQWLFDQFVFLNGRGEEKGLVEIFKRATPPCGHPSREGGEVGAEKAREQESLPLRGDLEGSFIPSGAGECCAPKLLQAAYRLGLQPLAMAEFWWGPSSPSHYREPGAFFPACHNKCRPILAHMLQGLDVEPDPALHYDHKVLAPVRVLWEDDYLAVVLKPEGWCSIPGRSDQANLFDEAHRIWPEIEGSVIVHRLDQDTSGVMVIAKTPVVHRALCRQFEQREVHKRYVALLEREIQNMQNERRDAGEGCVISLPIGPDLEHMPRRRVDNENGKEAVTRYEVLGAGKSLVSIVNADSGKAEAKEVAVTRVAFYPETGRTHQLRVHAAAAEGLNTPILGDRLYGHVADRLYLHAESISFVHPVTGEQMQFAEPAPF